MSSKYYVYGGGRWRELDAATGRVNGWRGARLCVARRGRLVVQRGAARARLLAALRALAAGRPGAARLGPRLPRKPSRARSTRSGSDRSRCRCCCHHNNNNRTSEDKLVRSKRSLTSDACIQTAPPAPPPPPRPRLAFPPPAPAPTRTTSTPRRSCSTGRKNDGDSSGSSTEPPLRNTKTSPIKSNTSPAKKANLSLKRKRQLSNSETTESSKDDISISQSILKKDFNAKYSRPRKSARRASPSRTSLSRASPSRTSPSRANPSRTSPPRARKSRTSTPRASSPGHRPPRIRTRVIPSRAVHVSSDDENKDPSVNFTSLKNTQDTETDEEATKRNKSIDLFAQDTYRELVISEEDVDILRRFMLKHEPSFDLYRYDDDDAYKARYFYSINPLVNLRRCPRIARMLDARDEGLSLRQFASQLGLRSVSEAGGRAPPRRRRRRDRDHTPDSEDKENLETSVRRTTRRSGDDRKKPDVRHGRDDDGETRKGVDGMTEVTVSIERLKDRSVETNRRDLRGPNRRVSRHNIPRRNDDRDDLKRKIDRSGDDTKLDDESRTKRQKISHEREDNIGEDETRQVNKKNAGGRADLAKRRNGAGGEDFRSKEYSSLEDHVIVEWISSGERARLVNGNRVWRSLETAFEEAAGRRRSWHSLRNRYLRHLLPALGRLALPPGTQARLRAAAARGEIKDKKHPPRRNSIFEEPARGASSRRRAPAPSPPPPAPAPAPARYSDVTRQFAARHPTPPSSSSSSSEFETRKTPKTPRVRPRTPHPRSPTTRSRTRKLYNPNKL